MAESPSKGAIDNVTYKLKVNGNEVKGFTKVLSLEVQRTIGRIPTAIVRLVLPVGHGDDQAFRLSESEDYAPGKPVEIEVGYHTNYEPVFKGIIVGQSIRSQYDQPKYLELRCSDKAVKMTLGRKSAFYVDQTDSAIIGALIDEHGLEKDVEATSYTHPQLTQLHSTNWDFLRARADANGLLVFAEDGKVMVKKPESSAEPELEVLYGKDVLAFDARIESRYQAGATTCKSWAAKTQAMLEKPGVEPTLATFGNLNGTTLAETMGSPDEDWISSSPLANEELQSWADARLVRSRLTAMHGTVTFFGNAKPKLNTLIELGGFGERYNGKALITDIYHRVKAGRWETTIGFGLSPEWHYEQVAISSPPAGGLLPGISGLHIGKVKKLDEDPLNENRIQVDIPSIDAAGEKSTWARLSNFYATSGKGSFFLPEIGDEVVLGFLNGDPRYAVILGSLYSSSLAPPYPLEAENKIKAIVTNSELKVEFDDDQKILTLETPKKNTFILSDKDKKITIKDQSGNLIEMSDSGITIKSAKDITMEATGNINIKANQNIAAKSSGGNFSAEGLQVAMKAQTSFSAQGSAQAEVKSSGMTTIKGSMVMIN